MRKPTKRPKKPAVKPASKIAAATGVAGGTGTPGVTATAIEEAMAKAGLKAMSEGITDPDKIRARKLEAREAVKAEHK